MAWRAMTAEETASRPEAHLGGSLLLVVVCAAALAVTFVITMLLAILMVASGTLGLSVGNLFRSGMAGLGALYAVPMLFLLLWALAFSLMTLVRSPFTPSFAAGGLIGWVGVRLVIGIIGQFWIASRYSGDGGGLVLQSVLPMLLAFVGEIMLVAGFWIYMRDGDRPNGYYRRLVRA
ncbi:MAG: hypothetical protein KF889_26115 [Alphaproteobacteria bacterium]|nr:hypothetical protein [Alphaproteobacteria bacterium]MCW5739528.1 hypothetical protein [Alphaproteobacteria bacterium]